MLRYALYACDILYNGANDMSIVEVVECPNEFSIYGIGKARSLDVINTFDIITRNLEKEVEYNIYPGMTDEAIDGLRAEIYEEDTKFTLEKVKDSDKSTEELNELIQKLGYEDFVNLYCGA